MKLRTRVAAVAAVTTCLVAGQSLTAHASGYESGNLGCGTRWLSAVALGNGQVTAKAPGKTDSKSSYPAPIEARVVSGYHSGAWSTQASIDYYAANSYGYCYG